MCQPCWVRWAGEKILGSALALIKYKVQVGVCFWQCGLTGSPAYILTVTIPSRPCFDVSATKVRRQ